MIRGVLLDLAGVIYEGDHALPGAVDAVARLRAGGLPLRFITNTTRKTKHALLRRLTGLGLDIEDDELFTPARAARDWLAAHDASPVLVVHPNLESEFASVPVRETRAVVVGDAGEAFDYGHLNTAFARSTARADRARQEPHLQGRRRQAQLDAGAFVTALEYASGQTARVLGKPSPDFFAGALAPMDCPPETAVMVGDDAEADVAGALQAGLANALLVRTGKYRDGDETRFEPHPTATVADLAAAADWILDRQ
ncbi:TIGR01458 family HAD-type hydrolase [Methyloceanibacter superfactus]|uniref:TIGR01458 family HAD-type hydrolase n=1 Tax=Methyloceanibacter superfactus TaxID=1774969 RepID=UPI000A550494|nr:TIGR01458 family HAD-type hydrolase [Methyloceanibacter superfactus]